MRTLTASLSGLLLGAAASAALAAPPADTTVTPSDNTHCLPAHAAAHPRASAVHAPAHPTPAARAPTVKHETREHPAANPHPHQRAASAPKQADTTAPCR
jgi:hypothetical protein